MVDEMRVESVGKQGIRIAVGVVGWWIALWIILGVLVTRVVDIAWWVTRIEMSFFQGFWITTIGSLLVGIVLTLVYARNEYSLERLWVFNAFLILFTISLLSVLRSIIGIGFFARVLQVRPATSIVYLTVLELGLFVVALGGAYHLAYRGGYSRLMAWYTS